MDLRCSRLLALGLVIAVFAGDSAGSKAEPLETSPYRGKAAVSQIVLVVGDKSGLAGPSSPLYLASNRNGWNPGDPAMRLSARSDGRWQIVLPDLIEPIEFKFTRGGWETVEVAADLSDIPNRRLDPLDASRTKASESPTLELTIEKFADQRPDAAAKKVLDPYRTVQAVGTVRRLQVVGGGVPALVRDALVWLPPGYDDAASASRRYPVLFLQDGQNVFEQPPGVPGEWRADETATELIQSGAIEPLIIVAIPNAGAARASEYLPTSALPGVEAHADEYVAFVLNEVVPRIERAFRTKPGPENRAIGGSSLGGLVSLYAATRHPEVFGKILAESPSLVLGHRPIGEELFGSVARWPGRVYIGMGGRESIAKPGDDNANREYTEAAAALDRMVAAAGLAPERHLLVIAPEAVHDEQAWAARLPRALKFLFPPTGDPR